MNVVDKCSVVFVSIMVLAMIPSFWHMVTYTKTVEEQCMSDCRFFITDYACVEACLRIEK